MEREKDPHAFYTIQQGVPRDPSGSIFKVNAIEILDTAPALFESDKRVRSYDLAITKDGGDYTVGLLLCAHEKRIIVLDMWRVREGPDAVEQGIKGNAIRDGVRTIIDLPKDPGQAGKYQVNALTAALRGYQVVSSPEEKSKIVRANVAAVQVNQGLVSVVRAGWNDAFLAELRDFTEGARHDDIVDALSRGVVNLGDLGLTHEERLELL